MDEKSEWIQLYEEAQINDIIRESEFMPVIIYKHSTHCGLSYTAKNKLERGWDMFRSKARLYYLDLIQYRSVSNAVAERFQIGHQSPQVLVIKNGRSVYDASHHLIDVGEISRQL